MPKHPSMRSVPLNTIVTEYGATFIWEAIARFIASSNHPDWTQRQVEDAVLDTFLPFRALPIYHKMKFVNGDFIVVDAVHAQPARRSRRRPVSGRFDTALVNVQEGEDIGIQGNLPVCSLLIHCINTHNVRSSRRPNSCDFQSSQHCHRSFRTTP
jgi:hypothetical protein